MEVGVHAHSMVCLWQEYSRKHFFRMKCHCFYIGWIKLVYITQVVLLTAVMNKLEVIQFFIYDSKCCSMMIHIQ